MPCCADFCCFVQTGAIGQLKQLQVQVLIPSYLFNKDDIRFKAKLAGKWVAGLMRGETEFLAQRCFQHLLLPTCPSSCRQCC